MIEGSQPTPTGRLRILLVYGGLQLGGIETYLRDLVEVFSKLGHDVAVLTTDGGDVGLRRAIEAHAKIISVTPWQYARPYVNRKDPLGDLQFDLTICLHAQALWYIGCKWKDARYGKVLVGLYHPLEARVRRPEFLGWRHAAIREIQRIPASSLVFTNSQTLLAHAANWARDLSEANIVPAGVRLRRLAFRDPGDAVRGKVVSIGRLVDFKTYTADMIRICPRLVRNRIPLSYHVYGDGQELPRLLELAEQVGAGDTVKFHGKLPYAHLERATREAWLFVGMGRALVEACGRGIPAIVARMDAVDGACYGFFHEIEGDNTSEPQAGLPTYSLEKCIQRMWAFDDAEYRRACLESKLKAVSLFDMDDGTEKLLAAQARAPVWRPRFGYADYGRDLLQTALRAISPATRQRAWAIWSDRV